MTASLIYESGGYLIACKPCNTERYEPNRAVARRLVTEHNHTKHKEN